MKKLFSIAALVLFSLTVVSAKTYDITVSTITKVGSVQLKPGAYKLKVEGANATFTDNKQTLTTPVKIQEGDKKYDDTRIHSSKDGADDRINEIDLGGSKTKLGF